MDGWGETVRVCSGGEVRGMFESAGREGGKEEEKEGKCEAGKKKGEEEKKCRKRTSYYFWINKEIINYL